MKTSPSIDTPVPAAQMPSSPHVFSMSCKVTAVNGDLATPQGREKAIAWWRRHGFTRLWLESYRHGVSVPSPLLVEERDAFRAEGFEVCGMITPTMLNDPAPGASEPQMVVCWSDPVARERMKAEVARAAGIFDTVILDDFLFSGCGDSCPSCQADMERRGIADPGEYRRALMLDVCENDILPAAMAANPNAHFIIKYPCWYRHYAQRGYSPAKQAELFGECWIGTETRDANPEPLQACWIMAWMDAITHGRCGGGWYDALDCSPDKFIEQARYTILGGARESLVHCYDYLLAEDPGRTPFGEKADLSHACREAFERESESLRALAERLRGAERLAFDLGPDGVSRHLFRKDGEEFSIEIEKGEMRETRMESPGPNGVLPLNCNRRAVLDIFEENVYGVRPDFDGFAPRAEVVAEERIADAGAIRKTVAINTMTPLGETTFNATAYFPEKREKAPVFVMPGFDQQADEFDYAWRGAMPSWPVNDILARGCATVTFNYNDVLRDDPHVLDGIDRPPNGWGAISAWALAASRVADWLEAEPLAEAGRIGIVGLSRLGKTALWAGATDPRFAMVCPTCSGLFGARMATRNLGGETIDQITEKFPHWLAPQCRGKWCGRDWELPFDQHWLLAAVAPRLLAVGSAEDDWWACPSGEFCAWECSRQRFWELGVGANTTYHLRHGGHGITPEDWKEYLDFAGRHGWTAG